MIRLQQMSIHNKLSLALGVAALLAFALASIALMLFGSLTLEGRARQIMEPYAHLVSVGAEAAVAFQDPGRAREILNTLHANPQILEAEIVLQDGRLLAGYSSRSVTTFRPNMLKPDGVYLNYSTAELLQSMPDGAHLRLVMGLDELKRQTRNDLLVFATGVLVLLLATTLGLRAALQRTIVRPISTLAETVEAVRIRADYQQRVPASGTDEVARLGRSFNAMMEAIQERDDDLSRLTLFQRTLLDNVACGIISTSPDGIVTSINPAAERLLGYTADEVVGKQTPACWHDPQEIAQYALRLSEELGETIPPGFDAFAARPRRNLPEENEWTFIRKDGMRVPVLLSVTALRDESGRITGLVGLTYDLREHKRMEHVLRESEERFRTLTEKSPVGVYIIQDDLFRYVNPAFADIHGYAPEEIIDILGPLDFLTPEDREQLLVSFQPGIDFSHQEFHIRRKDGSIRVVETFGSLASHQGLPAIIGTIIDITERKRSEEQLFQVTERWKRTFDAVPDLIAIIDADFRVVQVNKAMADRLGATQAECVGQLCYEAVHKSEAPPPFCPHAQTLKDCHEHMCEVREECLGGDFIVTTSPIYDSAGQLMGSVHVARDITERKRAETKLNEQLHFLQQLLDSIPIPVYYKNIDGLYLGCNTAFERIIGLSKKDIIGKTVYEVSRKERADKYQEADSALLRQPGVQVYEATVIDSDGECKNIIFNKATFVDANNCVAGIVGAMIDITERKKAEDERKMLESQLHQAQKMEAIGQLAGGIAHDFNNILTAIMGYAAMILLKMEKGNPFRRHLEQILASSERAAELTKGLLAFSRRQVLHAKPMDLCEVVRSLEKMLGRLVPEDIDFRTTLAEGDLTVMADKGQIEQVLMNLVTNAKDAMPMGGTLSIEVSPTVIKERFVHAHGYGEPGDYACVTVSDTGHGMDEETRKKMFEPFFTTKEVGKGTGLGMAIIYGIIQQHKGYISIYSEKEIGTTIKIYLPLISEEIGAASEVPEAKPSTGGTETVLLAEDDAAVLELHRMILEEAGYRVIEAVDGQEALEKFTEHRTEVDILATDVIMPKMNGKSLYDEIRKIRPDMKVLFMSGYTKDIIVERGIMEDEFSIVTKPVTSYELLKKVREILDRDRL